MLNEMFGGDEEITQQLFELYLAENSEIGNVILQHYETNDLSTLFHTVHTLSGALGNLCEMNILPLIKEIEASAKVGNTPEKDTIDAVINGLDEIKQQMEVYLSAQ
ncbi:Hpt domain-containing protein [Aliivibrio fischeri]|nr:Hpt domain-containing protein [Aliivibrio fischeri]MUK38697.1 Hpt domain-containing protein [Aliivibrio fischeri]MUK92722.1 Hpt domain-containing protein [Aliivibrio fischeri]MUL01699.1 Hpt domain-containing protein [Aliivibrio fischeri]MUL04861.1 Hpt domain-containing protein [Aliivibrio fischeri]